MGFFESVIGVQFIHIGALEPVTQQGRKVDEIKTLLETEIKILLKWENYQDIHSTSVQTVNTKCGWRGYKSFN